MSDPLSWSHPEACHHTEVLRSCNPALKSYPVPTAFLLSVPTKQILQPPATPLSLPSISAVPCPLELLLYPSWLLETWLLIYFKHIPSSGPDSHTLIDMVSHCAPSLAIPTSESIPPRQERAPRENHITPKLGDITNWWCIMWAGSFILLKNTVPCL